MPAPLTFTLTLLFNQTVPDAGGNGGEWQYAAANVFNQAGDQVAQLIATKRDNSSAGFTFPASMLTATLLFPSQDGGVPPNLTIQGVHSLTPPGSVPVVIETGSVSSASPEYAEFIGGSFTFTFDPANPDASVLQISAAC